MLRTFNFKKCSLDKPLRKNKDMKKDLVKTICRNAFVATNYVVLTLAMGPLAYLPIQVRISEALVLLCFFRKDYIWGLTIGCFIANLFSPYPLDILVGTLATFLSCLCICFCKHLLIASIFPVAFNGFIIAAEIAILEKSLYWPMVGTIALGELISVSIIGYLLFRLLRKNRRFLSIMKANQNLDFKW